MDGEDLRYGDRARMRQATRADMVMLPSRLQRAFTCIPEEVNSPSVHFAPQLFWALSCAFASGCHYHIIWQRPGMGSAAVAILTVMGIVRLSYRGLSTTSSTHQCFPSIFYHDIHPIHTLFASVHPPPAFSCNVQTDPYRLGM